MYSRHRRGKLWNRLALIQENYVKPDGHQQCLETIHQALNESTLQLPDRLALCERARKLMARPKAKLQLIAPWVNESPLMCSVPLPREVSVSYRTNI
jgi:hypothetical protein